MTVSTASTTSTASCRAATRAPAISWGASVYKVGDPVLFNETERFRPVIYNNLKGRIVDIEPRPGRIQFDVELDRPLTRVRRRRR